MLWLLVGLVVFTVSGWALGRWVLSPVDKVAGQLRAPTKFLLTDFIWLMLQLQLGLSACLPLLGADGQQEIFSWIILATVTLSLLALWAASVSVVSRAGIVQPLRRAVVILLLIPGTLGIIICLPLLVMAAIGYFAFRIVEPRMLDLVEPRWIFLSSLAFVGVIAATFILRQVSFWVLRTDGPDDADSLAGPTLPQGLVK